MEVSQRALAVMLICALICGMILGGVYDILRMTRVWISGFNHGAISPRMTAIKNALSLPDSLQLKSNKKIKPSTKKRMAIATGILCAQDILFCLLFAVVAALLLYQTNDGQLRLSAIVAMLLGMGLYLATLGRVLQQVWPLLTILLRAILIWIIAILIYPIRLLGRLLEFPTRWLAGQWRHVCSHIKAYLERRKQAKEQRKQKKNHNKINKAEAIANIKFAGQQPDGKYVFVSGRRRPQ